MYKQSLIYLSSYRHISLIKDSNSRLPYDGYSRFQQADKYIAKQQYLNVTNYKEFALNDDAMIEKFHVNVSQAEENLIKALLNTDRPDFAWTREATYETQRIDDLEPAEPYEHKTLFGFFKEAVKERKNHHKYFLVLLGAIPLYIYLFVMYWHPFGEEKRQTVVVADPYKMDTFNIVPLRMHTQQLDKRMGHLSRAVQTGNPAS